MNTLICRSALLLLLVHLVVVGQLAAQGRPNVVLIMTDDQGIGDFGVMGNPIIETPNIDALATTSASLSTFYVSPVCSPTRACLMTGRYNYRTRCIDTYVGRSMLEPEEVTVAEELSSAGYATGIFGKWHLGDCYPMRAIDQGFDEALLHRGGGLAQPADPRENHQRYTDAILMHNGQQVHTSGYCTEVYFDAALKFIEQAQDNGKNFFVYLPTNAPHSPYHDVPEDWRKHYQKKDLRSLIVGKIPQAQVAREVDKLSRIASMITNIDQNVGRLLHKLDQLNLSDNTMVIFLTDNGPNTERFVGPLRGYKTHVHEGGIRAPLWIRWPRRFKAGTTRNELAAHIDMMPTILDACGVQSTQKLDGRSLLPLLLGKEVPWSDRTLVIQSHRGDQPARYHHFMIRDSRWKLLHASGFEREAFQGPPTFELYDLDTDPGETRNLADQQKAILERLKAEYDKWFDDVSSTRTNNYAPPRIHVGTPHENRTVLTRQDWRGGTWARNSQGHWQLYVATPGRYLVRLLFDPHNTDETVTLNAGLLVTKTKAEAGVDSCELEVTLQPGDMTLEATLANGEKKRGVYQVIVRRRDGISGSK